MSHTPYYYAPGGKYVLFLDLLGFTAFVRSSFQKKAEETDDREKEFELAQKQFKIAQAEVEREYRRFHEHLLGGDAHCSVLSEVTPTSTARVAMPSRTFVRLHLVVMRRLGTDRVHR
jgi:hypothetical protein